MDTNEQKLLARCAAIGASSWSDALDELAINGVLQGITQRSGSGRVWLCRHRPAVAWPAG